MNEIYQQQPRSNRQVYYVDVQAQRLYTQPDIAAYHLVITANEDEVRQIEEQFRYINARDEHSLQRMVLFSVANEEHPVDRNNEALDSHMRELFRLLHERGTEETRKFIDSMNIL